MHLRSFFTLIAAACCVQLVACSGDVTTNITVEPGGTALVAGEPVAVAPLPETQTVAVQGETDAPQDGEPRDDIVWIWLQDHRDFNQDVLLDACDVWSPVGLVCGLTDDPDAAEVHIYANEATCVDEDGDGSLILATAFWTWDIVVETTCIRRTWDDDPDERWLLVLLAHEIGHVIGLPHVFWDCQNPDVRTHTSGQRICGNSVMNPILNPVADQMTAADWLNWEMRTPNVGPEYGEGATCTLLAVAPAPE